ncbi:MAG: hypothetical protein ACRCZR_08760 [Cetobacterium sp.]
MKKRLLLVSCLILANTLFANENLNTEVPAVDSEESITFDEKQQNFVNSIQQELENTKLELNKYKTDSEKNAAIVKKIGKKWNHEVYFGVEQEINSDNDWKFLDGSLATSPYTGMFLYKDDSKLLYDFQFLKTFIDHNEEYNRNRFSTGVTYRDSFKLENGKTGNWGLRVGYRNDSYHWDSMKAGTSASTYSGYVRKGEERNEIWIRPTGSLNITPKVRLNTSLSFRIIDRELDYARFGKDYSKTTRDWSNIQDHSIGMRYTLDNKNFMSLDYQFVRENLKRTLLNTEHFAMLRYFHFLPNKDTVSPYVRIPLVEGEQKYYNGVKEVVRVDDVTRPRLGVQYRHHFTPSTNLMLDVYYRPQNIEPSNGIKRHENFFLWTAELTHKF